MRTTHTHRIGRRMLSSFAGISFIRSFLSAQNSPDNRQITDPKSVVSASERGGGPGCPIPQLLLHAEHICARGLPTAATWCSLPI